MSFNAKKLINRNRYPLDVEEDKPDDLIDIVLIESFPSVEFEWKDLSSPHIFPYIIE